MIKAFGQTFFVKTTSTEMKTKKETEHMKWEGSKPLLYFIFITPIAES